MNEVVEQVSAFSDKKVTLTAAAQDYLLTFLEERKNCRGVRFSVKKTGCSGYSYVVDYVVEPQPDDLQERLSDKFDIYIDKKSYPYLKGMTIDFIKQGLNAKLVFNNPNQSGQCGCGESFTVS